MGWLAQNWFWVLLFVLFIGMHFGHGGHGGGCGGGHKKHKRQDDNGQSKTDKNSPPGGHQH